MDSCYRDFSYFSAPRAHAMASRPEIAGSARNPADESRPHIRSRAVALRAAPRGDCRRVFLLLPRNLQANAANGRADGRDGSSRWPVAAPIETASPIRRAARRGTEGKFSSLQSFEKSRNAEGISPEPREDSASSGSDSSTTPPLRRNHFHPWRRAATSGVSLAQRASKDGRL